MARRPTDIFEFWDEFHPIEANEPLEAYDDDPPAIPTIDHLPALVEYSTRSEGDWVLSGPLAKGQGPGRYYSSELEAFQAAVKKYGQRRVSRVSAGEFRWALLIRKA